MKTTTARHRPPPPACVYFQVHQPYRLVQYDFFRIGEHAYYENDGLNRDVFNKVADKCYLPATRLFRRLVDETGGRFRLGLSLSGTVLEQMEEFRPDVLDAFQGLAATESVEFLAETYYHSLAFLYSRREFRRQVELHREKIRAHFGQEPRVFRNTELIYSNALAAEAEDLGFDGILAEGSSWLLGTQSPNHLCRAPIVDRIVTLLRNPGLSDDIGFRFSDRNWSEFPMTPAKFTGWMRKQPGDLLNLFMDFETIGEHQWEETGIFRFWEEFGREYLAAGGCFLTPSEVVDRFNPRFTYDCHVPSSWADYERDLSAWLGNVMQKEAAEKINRLEDAVAAAGDPALRHAWAKLQTSDHLHHMSTKGGTDGMVHQYFCPYDSPYDAYIYLMNCIADLQVRVQRAGPSQEVA